MFKKSHIEQERTLKNVRQVVMEDFGDLTIQTGNVEKLVVEAESEMLPHVFSPVTDGKLTLSLDSAWLEKLSNSFTLRDLRYILTLKSLESLEITGLARVSVSEVKGDSFTLRLTGRTNATIEHLNVENLECVLHWGSRLTVNSGKVSGQKIVLSHGSKYTAGSLSCLHAEVELSAESRAFLQAQNTLSASVAEGCSLEYDGIPTLQVSGNGAVNRKVVG